MVLQSQVLVLSQTEGFRCPAFSGGAGGGGVRPLTGESFDVTGIQDGYGFLLFTHDFGRLTV